MYFEIGATFTDAGTATNNKSLSKLIINIAFGRTVDFDGTARILTSTAETGTATFGGNVGGLSALVSLAITAAAVNVNPKCSFEGYIERSGITLSANL